MKVAMTTSDEVGGNGKSGQKNQAAEAVEQTSAPSGNITCTYYMDVVGQKKLCVFFLAVN